MQYNNFLLQETTNFDQTFFMYVIIKPAIKNITIQINITLVLRKFNTSIKKIYYNLFKTKHCIWTSNYAICAFELHSVVKGLVIF